MDSVAREQPSGDPREKRRQPDDGEPRDVPAFNMIAPHILSGVGGMDLAGPER